MSHALRPRRALAVTLTVSVGVLLACASRGAASGSGAPRSPAPGSATAARGVADTSTVAIGDGKSIERLFAGRFAGVEVKQTTGGGLQFRIRGGGNSLVGGDEPLFVVDGTPLPTGTGGIVYMNPYDIQKIEVLKNPADVAVYGLRGGNGVIRITTKRPGSR